ncbi:MAG: hypothetical protein FWC12_05930 [Treponema sp.]|nr:hypothetical protein [Treponema sp.]
MKKNKWFVMAALFGLLLSVCFILVGCDLLNNCNCSGGCKNMDLSGMDCSGMDLSGMSCR